MNFWRIVSTAIAFALFVTPASAGPGGMAIPDLGSDFTGMSALEPSSAFFDDGGWLVFSIPAVGDVLYGCPSLSSESRECKPVVLPIRGVGSTLERWFIDPATGSAWFKVSAPPMGDFVLACFDPRAAPYCTAVDIENRPPGVTLSRLGAGGTAGGGTGAGGLLPQPGTSPSPGPNSIEPCADAKAASCNPATFWMAAALPIPGPVNLYACGGLDDQPACRLAISGLGFIEAESFGLEKLTERPRDEGGVVVVVGSVASGSSAEEAGLRDGDVVLTASGFELLSAAHLKGLLLQVPVGESIRLEIEGRGLVKLTRDRRD